ncbi:hypothetical protein FDECE_18500 [Fusarium decemcellulare]|nr:hypothetical protein FDECE_18500 [Fusarium decemcellulare]
MITGASSGIGIETAKAMYQTGATLFLPVRNLDKTCAALGDLVSSDRVHLLYMGLDSLSSVRACAADFLSKSATLDIFIGNAGMMTSRRETTKDGFEKHFGTNHLAHFLLFNLLQPALEAGAKSGRASRVIMLSSIAHRFAETDLDDLNCDRNFDGMLAYGRSKTAVLWNTNQIERLYESKGIHAWSVHPGAITTGLTRNLSEEERRADDNNTVKLAAIKVLLKVLPRPSGLPLLKNWRVGEEVTLKMSQCRRPGTLRLGPGGLDMRLGA